MVFYCVGVQTPDADLSVRCKEMMMTNMTSLPLTATLQVKYPFQVSFSVATVVEEDAPVSLLIIQCLMADYLSTVIQQCTKGWLWRTVVDSAIA